MANPPLTKITAALKFPDEAEFFETMHELWTLNRDAALIGKTYVQFAAVFRKQVVVLKEFKAAADRYNSDPAVSEWMKNAWLAARAEKLKIKHWGTFKRECRKFERFGYSNDGYTKESEFVFLTGIKDLIQAVTDNYSEDQLKKFKSKVIVSLKRTMGSEDNNANDNFEDLFLEICGVNKTGRTQRKIKFE